MKIQGSSFIVIEYESFIGQTASIRRSIPWQLRCPRIVIKETHYKIFSDRMRAKRGHYRKMRSQQTLLQGQEVVTGEGERIRCQCDFLPSRYERVRNQRGQATAGCACYPDDGSTAILLSLCRRQAIYDPGCGSCGGTGKPDSHLRLALLLNKEWNVTRYLLDDIKTKQLQWYGHVQRMEEGRLPTEVMKWRPPGRRKRGRRKLTWTEGIRGRMGEKRLTFWHRSFTFKF